MAVLQNIIWNAVMSVQFAFGAGSKVVPYAFPRPSDCPADSSSIDQPRAVFDRADLKSNRLVKAFRRKSEVQSRSLGEFYAIRFLLEAGSLCSPLSS